MYTRQNAIVIMILIAISPDFPHISQMIAILGAKTDPK
jgi:hypothetical protein